MPPIDLPLLPSGPGAHTEWTTLFGAPTHWEAVVDDADASFVRSATTGQRDSFAVPVPVLESNDTVSLLLRCWMRRPGELLSGAATTVGFVRAFGIDMDSGTWSLAQADPDDPGIPGPVVQMPDLVVTGLSAADLLDGAFEIGARRSNARDVRLLAIRCLLTVVPFSDRIGLVGSRRLGMD